MGAPLARSKAVQLLEDAVDLIRRTGAGALIQHWMGSVPLAMAVLFAWNSVRSARTSDATWAAQSLLLALMLVWMNCWRAVYANHLRRSLSGVPDRRWTSPRVLQLVSVQSFLAGTKLIVLPVSILTLFPWAKTVAVYRNLAVLAGREDIGPREALRQARRVASFQPVQNWVLLGLLGFLQSVLALNLILVLGAVPQLIRVVTGYESTYSRSGVYFVLNPMFVALVLSVSWILFDPFAQAVYCMRSFEAESSETGEDLRCGLRRLRAPAQVAAVLGLLAVAAPLVRADLAREDLERSVHQAMQAPEYDWRFPAAPARNTPLVSSVLERILADIRRAIRAVRDAFGRFARWIFERLFQNGAPGMPGAPPGKGLDWTVAALIALVIAAGAFFAWQRSRARTRLRPAGPQPLQPVRLDAPDLTADLLSENRWIELAEICLAEQNYRIALRAFYLASLAWLGRREFLSIHPGKTNHEYARELNRRLRDLPGARALFAGNVASFERAWYGAHEVSAEDTVNFRRSMEELQLELTRMYGAAS